VAALVSLLVVAPLSPPWPWCVLAMISVMIVVALLLPLVHPI